MKKVTMKHLQLAKETISSLEKNTIKGGVSGMCTSSVDPHECYFACATGQDANC